MDKKHYTTVSYHKTSKLHYGNKSVESHCLKLNQHKAIKQSGSSSTEVPYP